MCDLGHPKDDHDCMLNFEDSAKAMEPEAAVLLVNNAIFKECNVQLGIFMGDNGSSAICIARNAVDYEIIKHDDINHTSKSVTSLVILPSYKLDLNACRLTVPPIPLHAPLPCEAAKNFHSALIFT